MSALTFAAVPRREQECSASLLLPVALGLGAFIAAAHLESAVQAVSSSWALALVLAAVAALVATWTWRLWRGGSVAVARAGAGLFGALAALWLASRTAGLPFGLAPRAPIGPLDALTALDEVLLVGLPLLLTRPLAFLTRRGPGIGFIAMSASFVMLSMGCQVGTSATGAQHLAGHAFTLYCHLF